eukprot:4999745-Prymnesium_polylepis.1
MVPPDDALPALAAAYAEASAADAAKWAAMKEPAGQPKDSAAHPKKAAGRKATTQLDPEDEVLQLDKDDDDDDNDDDEEFGEARRWSPRGRVAAASFAARWRGRARARARPKCEVHGLKSASRIFCRAARRDR